MDCLIEFRRCSHTDMFRFKIRCKRCTYRCSVFVCNINPDGKRSAQIRQPHKAWKRRSKQKELDSPCSIVFDDLWQNRKRRVVYYNPAVIVKMFIIAAGIKRSAKVRLVKSVFARRPLSHRIIHQGRRIAVVCCFLWLEFFHKAFIVFKLFFVLARCRHHITSFM